MQFGANNSRRKWVSYIAIMHNVADFTSFLHLLFKLGDFNLQLHSNIGSKILCMVAKLLF